MKCFNCDCELKRIKGKVKMVAQIDGRKTQTVEEMNAEWDALTREQKDKRLEKQRKSLSTNEIKVLKAIKELKEE